MHEKHEAVLRLPEGRALIAVRFTERMPNDGALTINHDPITETYTEVSFQGEVFGKGQRDPHSAGQIQDSLPQYHPIRLLWERWHLNGMRSHCAHQDRSQPWDITAPCEESGYRCGTAWLIEPLPVEVVRQIIAVMTTDVKAV